MNSNIQLMLFPEPSVTLDASIKTISADRIPLPNHLHFVRELGVFMTMLPAGSVILAAAPSGHTADEVCAWLKDYLEHDPSRAVGERVPEIATIVTPMAANLKAQRRRLLDEYQKTSHLKRTHAPQFLIDFGASQNWADPLMAVSAIIAGRSIDYYVLRDADNLQRAGGAMWDARDQVRFVIQLARTSGRTHIIFARPTTVRDWLLDHQIAEAVSHCFLRPYDLRNESDRQTFQAFAAAIDAQIPWAAGESLVAHLDEIDEVVCGSPQRLRKWVVQALTGAKVQGLKELTWKFVSARRPLPCESNEAKAEFRLLLDDPRHEGPTAASSQSEAMDVEEPKKKKAKRKNSPGRCNPTRRDVGTAAA